MNNFAERLEILIKTNKTKKKDLAEAIGLTPSAITDMVKGRSNSTGPARRAIANFYHVNEDWLEHGRGDVMAPIEPKTDNSSEEYGDPLRIEVDKEINKLDRMELAGLLHQLLQKARAKKD